MKLSLANTTEESAIKHIVIEINNEKNTVSFKKSTGTSSIISTSDFLKQYHTEFTHPLLSFKTATITDNGAVFCYHTDEEFFDIAKMIYATFIKYAPTVQHIKVYPAKAYLKTNKEQQVLYGINFKKRAKETISTAQLEKFIHLNTPVKDYYYHDGNILDDTISIEDLPEDVSDNDFISDDDGLTAIKRPPPFEMRFISNFLGHGIFATEDIKKDTPVGIYNGKYSFSEKEEISKYRFAMKGKPLKLSVDASTYGSLSRFINHAPKQSQLIDTIKPKDWHHDVLSANIEPCEFYHCGMLAIVLIAKRDIKKGEQLFFDYSETYWNQIECWFFTKDHQIINAAGEKPSSVKAVTRQNLKKMVECDIKTALIPFLLRPSLFFLLLILIASYINR